ncbi:hypothetical protein [Amycolatopsis sp. NPDC051102]|uniref:hypothetical protein n=1 Tax=Amycolatopsis sp. NPDC051102 TaxID=3155163 RepID=UPI00343466F3
MLQWLIGAVGDEALAYLLGCDLADIPELASGEKQPSGDQAEVVDNLSLLRDNMPSQLDEGSVNDAVRGWLMQVSSEGRTVAVKIHEHVSTADATPAADDELERAIVALALDVYVAFLFPSDLRMPTMMQISSIHVVRATLQHPAGKAFQEAALEDAVIGAIFETEVEHSGRTAMMYANTGSGGSLQLLMLSELLLNRAWRRMDSARRAPALFAQQAVSELRLARDLMAGKTRAIPAKIAFAGVLLPPGAQLKLDCGVIRAASGADRKLAPESLKGQLQGTDADGVTTLINYDGDVILDYDYPFRVRFTKTEMSDRPQPFPDDMRPPASFASAVTRLRFSLMLAADRPSRVQLVQTWQSIDAPLNAGSTISWSDPRQGTGIMPVQLTESELTAWGEWYERLNTTHVARIELALSRILRAIAERREPSDVLIDSVIAWENLFGTSEGEPTFRVTMCLAVLLEESTEARQELKKQLGAIYGLRSKVVHGSRNLKESEYPLCQEALEVAIRAIRTLVSERADILELSDGALRSTKLLLGG